MDADRLQQLVRQLHPDGTLARSWPLEGGISAKMTAFEVATPDGATHRYVARTPGAWRSENDPDGVAREFRTLAAVSAAGLPVPRAIYLSPRDPAQPAEQFYVMSLIDGRPELNPSDVDNFLNQFATQLARIHAFDWRSSLGDLRPQDDACNPPGATTNASLREAEIRAAIEEMPKPDANTPRVLRHGDFWPGNVLWKDGKLVAVVDWESACIGDALADLAICRLDIFFILGGAAMDAFTERYFTESKVDATDLTYWDLFASLRPIHRLPEWAAAYPSLGRPDVTLETMTRDHNRFVERALQRSNPRAAGRFQRS